MTVYKSPTCGCCQKWVEYLKATGFTVKTIDRTISRAQGGPGGDQGRSSSCHTAVVGGYVIEGHVPAADIQRLLKEKPKIVGLAAPGCRARAGMDTNKDPYEVLAFDARGRRRCGRSTRGDCSIDDCRLKIEKLHRLQLTATADG